MSDTLSPVESGDASALTDPTDPAAGDEAVAETAHGSATTLDTAEHDAAAEARIAVAEPEVVQPDDGSAFLSELVRAMQTTAAAERARIEQDTAQRREAHLAAVNARRESEADRLRELAETDLRAIDTWAENERRRIQVERERRAASRRDDLATSLAQHGAKIDREIENVEAAITAYHADVAGFFARFDHETDPVAIAQHAGRRPVFPALETIGDGPANPSAAEAPAADAPARQVGPDGGATDDARPAGDGPAAAVEQSVTAPGASVGVGIMGSAAAVNLADSWATWNEAAKAADASTPTVEAGAAATESAIPSAQPSVDSIAPAETPAVAEHVAVATTSTRPEANTANGPDSGSVFQSTPITRPMSWLRRDRSNGDHPHE
ncbi:MAG: hypothetical protein NVS9B8_08410 [Candidatus Limnocylindrales bacterium]